MVEALPTELVRAWGEYRPTRLIELPGLARLTHVGRVFVKLEGERPLGNFKSLGGMLAALRALAHAAGAASDRLICASEGNHGLSVAAAARISGAKASIYLPVGVSRVRAARIEDQGADIIWVSGTYDDAVGQAAAAAKRGEGLLIPDTTADPGDAVVKDVMAGYGLLTRELIDQFQNEVQGRPSHVFVQAGVGGLAAAMAEGLRGFMLEPNKLLVVEPEAAACVALGLHVGHPERVPGDLRTCAEMLSCGLASAPALEVLMRYGAESILSNESELRSAVGVLRRSGGPDTTPSGAAGLAGLLHVANRTALRERHQLGFESNVLLIATEGPHLTTRK